MTRIFIEDNELDILEDFSHQITYAVDDLKNFDSKATSFTKTIILPATANNNRLLGNIFEFSNSNFTNDGEPNVLYNFNAAKSAKARIEINGLQVMKGVLRLMQINIDGKNTEYEVALFGELGGFISKVGVKKLTDNENGFDNLDFSEYNHTYNITNVLNSWNPNYSFSINAQFYAPNYCTIFGRKGYLFQIGKQYSITDTANNNGTFIVTNINQVTSGYPIPITLTEIYFDGTIVNEAYGSVTFSYPKNGSSYIYPLIDYGNVSYNIPTSNPTYLAKRDYQLKAFRPAFFVKEIIDKIITAAGYTWESTFFNSDFFQRLIIPNNFKGLLRKNITNYVNAITDANQSCNVLGTDFYPYKTITIFFGNNTLSPNFTYNNVLGQFQYNGTGSIQVKLQLSFNYTLDLTSGFSIIYINVNNLYVSRNYLQIGNNNFTTDVIVTLNQYSTIQVKAYVQIGSGVGQYGNLTINSETLFNISPEPASEIPYQIGDTIIMNDLLPKNILQKDFFISILKMFNLMVTEDKFIDRHLIIEPWIDFYKINDSYLDWSDKVARNEVIKITPMSEVSARYYTLKYKDDTDYYNDDYKKQFNETYGTRTYDNGLEFAKDSATTEVIFAPTPLVGYTARDKVVSTIFKMNNNVEEQIESVIRIMQYKIIEGVDSWKIINTNSGTTSELATLTNYCYAGHLDDPDAPNSDINFGATKKLYFTLLSGALSNNIFNAFYSSYLAEITDKDSRLITCKMKFKDKDIFNLDFGRFIWVDGVLFRLIKIIDYCDNNICEVQLLRVIYTTYDLPVIVPQRLSFEYTGDVFDSTNWFYINTNSGQTLDIRVHWGDGTSNDYTGQTSYSNDLYHNYPSNTIWNIELEFLSTTGTDLYLAWDNIGDLFATKIVSNIQNIISFANHTNFTGQITYGTRNMFLTSEEVNNYLHQSLHLTSGDAIEFDYNVPSAPPTGQGVFDKYVLENNGVSVYTD